MPELVDGPLQTLLGLAALAFVVVAMAATVALVENRRVASARLRRRQADAAARATAVIRVRTELEERQAEVLIRRITTSSRPRARVLTASMRALDDDIRSIEALDTLVYDPMVWDPPSSTP